MDLLPMCNCTNVYLLLSLYLSYKRAHMCTVPMFTYWYVPAFSYWYVPMFTYWYVPMFSYWNVPMFSYWYVPMFSYWYVPMFVYWYVPMFANWYVHISIGNNQQQRSGHGLLPRVRHRHQRHHGDLRQTSAIGGRNQAESLPRRDHGRILRLPDGDVCPGEILSSL